MNDMLSKDQLDRIREILAEGNGDTPKASRVKVKQTYLFGKILVKTEVTFLGSRDLWVKS